MGYSTPKKQLDLKEFLSQPATKRPFRNGMAYRRPGAAAAAGLIVDKTPAAPPSHAVEKKAVQEN